MGSAAGYRERPAAAAASSGAASARLEPKPRGPGPQASASSGAKASPAEDKERQAAARAVQQTMRDKLAEKGVSQVSGHQRASLVSLTFAIPEIPNSVPG